MAGKHTHECPICGKEVWCNAEGFSDMHKIAHDNCLTALYEEDE